MAGVPSYRRYNLFQDTILVNAHVYIHLKRFSPQSHSGEGHMETCAPRNLATAVWYMESMPWRDARLDWISPIVQRREVVSQLVNKAEQRTSVDSFTVNPGPRKDQLCSCSVASQGLGGRLSPLHHLPTAPLALVLSYLSVLQRARLLHCE